MKHSFTTLRFLIPAVASCLVFCIASWGQEEKDPAEDIHKKTEAEQKTKEILEGGGPTAPEARAMREAYDTEQKRLEYQQKVENEKRSTRIYEFQEYGRQLSPEERRRIDAGYSQKQQSIEHNLDVPSDFGESVAASKWSLPYFPNRLYRIDAVTETGAVESRIMSGLVLQQRAPDCLRASSTDDAISAFAPLFDTARFKKVTIKRLDPPDSGIMPDAKSYNLKRSSEFLENIAGLSGSPKKKPSGLSTFGLQSFLWTDSPGPLYLQVTTTPTFLELRFNTDSSNDGAITWSVANGDSVALYNSILTATNRASVLVHSGSDLPKSLQKQIEANFNYVRVASGSPKKTTAELLAAAEFGSKALSKDDVRVFDALPEAADRVNIYRELHRMNLPLGQAAGWRNLRKEMAAIRSEIPFSIEPASKSEVLNELQQGTKDVAILIAHNQGGVLYLPGTGNKNITMHELQQLKRDTTPHRVVVLITCSAGTTNRAVASLSETLIQNRLAEAVFAPGRDIDAREVPALLKELSIEFANLGVVLKKRGYTTIVLNVESEDVDRVLLPIG